MKTISFAVLLLSFGLLAACSKKNDSPKSTFTALVNGVSFSATSVVATDVGGAFFISGTSADGKELTISIPNSTTTVTNYTIDDIYNQALYYTNTNTTPAVARNGTISIKLSGSTSASGVFSYTCKNGTVISNGAYTVFF